MYTGLQSNANQGTFVSNCFPVRYNGRLRSNSSNGGGAWMVVYRNKQKKQLKAVLCSKPKTYEDVRRQREIAEASGIPINDVELPNDFTPSVSARINLGKTLSKPWLLKHLKLADPADAAVIRIESCDLSRVDDNGFDEFVNVVHIKASDNVLPIDTFANFPSLEILELQMNGIGSASSVSASLLSSDNASILLADIYPCLKKLVLDYNELGAADFDSLSYLTNLESLSIIGNKISKLPPPDYQRLEANLFFPKLQMLDISENFVCTESDFLYLCGMPKVQHLNISRNGIRGIPSIHFTGHRYAIVPSRHNFGESDSPLNPRAILEDIEDESARALSTIAETTSERSSPALLLLPPFPELFVANLSYNEIASDMTLAGILSWPSLKEVILDGNPLAKRDEKARRRARKKPDLAATQDPLHVDTASSICEFLEQSLGINVVRSKAAWSQSQTTSKPSVGSAPSVLRRYPNLDAKIPKVPKCDVEKLLALCAPPPAFSETPPLMPPVKEAFEEPVINDEDTPTKEANQPGPVNDDANIQFFMTELAPDIDGAQIRAECEKALGQPDSSKKKVQLTITNSQNKALVLYDARYKGFEELFTTDEVEDKAVMGKDTLDLPTTLQDSVHVLRNMLELPSVSRRPAAAIDAWANKQMALRRKSKSKDQSSAMSLARSDRQPMRYEPYVSRHGPTGPPQTRTYGQIVDEVITTQKKRETVAEAPLGSVLHDGRSRNPKMYKSARRLLRQITHQYDRLRRDLDGVTESRESGLDETALP